MRNCSFSRNKSWIVFLFVIGLVLISAPYSYGGKVKSYTADQVFMDAEGNIKRTAKLYVTPEKFRMEGFPTGPQGNLVMIMRMDLKTNWTLNPEKKVYFERPLKEEEMKGGIQKTFKRGKEEALGTEKVSGYKCGKKRVTITTDFMGVKKESKSIYWVSEKFDMPLRMQSADGAITELRNIKKGQPPKRLFELPKGYSKVAGMFELFDKPSKAKAPKAAPKSKEGDEDFTLPEEVRKRLPKGFKLPFGN